MRRLLCLFSTFGLLLVGCASPATVSIEDTIDGEAVLAAAPAATRAAGTAHISMMVELSGPGVPGDTTSFLGAGQVDFVASRAFFQMDLGAFVPGMTMTAVTTPDAYYIGSPMFEEQHGAKWLRYRYSEAEQAVQMQGSLPGMGSDPAAMLDQLYGISDDVEVIGDDLIRGVDTTHYQATIRPESTLDQIPEEHRESVRALFESQGIDASYTVDVWIDGDGLARRLVMQMSLSEVEQTFTLDFYDYGVDVDIEVPTDGVLDYADAMEQWTEGSTTTVEGQTDVEMRPEQSERVDG